MIRARNLGYTFASGRVGIAAMDLDVEAGELLALVGPNGSGKTTLLRLLAGDLEPGAGTLMRTFPAGSQTIADSRSAIGFAPAQPTHFDELTGWENARFFARAYGASDDAVRARFARFDLLPDADIPAGEYSFGMERKLLLVQAMAHEPLVLLLDEPTIGLDPPAIAILTDELHDHVRAGRIVVIATNDARAAMLATRVVFVHRGRKIADASPSELLGSVARRTQIEVSLAGEPDRAPALPPQVIATRSADGLVFDAPDSAVLPDVCAALLRAGARIRAVRIREPDLGHVFRALTGESLSDDPLV